MVKANILGYVSNDGKKHQSGLVVDRGGIAPTEYAVQSKDPVKTIREYKFSVQSATQQEKIGMIKGCYADMG